MSLSSTQTGAATHVGQMRAGVYRGKGQMSVETVPIPTIQPGEVLFRVAACGICGTDIKKIQHGFVRAPFSGECLFRRWVKFSEAAAEAHSKFFRRLR